jgi:hypothetical protein
MNMTDKVSSRPAGSVSVDVPISFTYVIVHGDDPSLRAPLQKAKTKTLHLMGLTFETPRLEVGPLHISFTTSKLGRNLLEITLDLGKKFPAIEAIGQVDWYEKRSSVRGESFMVNVSFIDLQADAVVVLRQFLQTVRESGR